MKKKTTIYYFTIQIKDDMNELLSEARPSALCAYYQFWEYYDHKAAVQPIKKLNFCLLLNPRLVKNNQIGKSLHNCLPLYKAERVLNKSIYFECKVGTNNTQCLH